MRTKVRILLQEANAKLSGYTALLSYRLSNLCVKADPVSLLSIEFQDEGNMFGLEKIAKIAKLDDYSFAVIPNDMKSLGEIIKAIMKVHPEFKQEIKKFEEDKSDDEEDNTYLKLTMPEVDENRRDSLNDAKDSLCESFKLVFDESYEKSKLKISEILIGADKDEKDEADDALKEIYDSLGKKAESYKQMKETEIEEAYENYISKVQEQLAQKEEREKAEGKNAGLSFKLMRDEDE